MIKLSKQAILAQENNIISQPCGCNIIVYPIYPALKIVGVSEAENDEMFVLVCGWHEENSIEIVHNSELVSPENRLYLQGEQNRVFNYEDRIIFDRLDGFYTERV